HRREDIVRLHRNGWRTTAQSTPTPTLRACLRVMSLASWPESASGNPLTWVSREPAQPRSTGCMLWAKAQSPQSTSEKGRLALANATRKYLCCVTSQALQTPPESLADHFRITLNSQPNG